VTRLSQPPVWTIEIYRGASGGPSRGSSERMGDEGGWGRERTLGGEGEDLVGRKLQPPEMGL
jgi:hypothetical protein